MREGGTHSIQRTNRKSLAPLKFQWSDKYVDNSTCFICFEQYQNPQYERCNLVSCGGRKKAADCIDIP